MLAMVSEGYRRIQVTCDDTDVFILLVHHFHAQELQKMQPPVEVLMQSTSYTSKPISIAQTVGSLLKDLIISLLAAHALTGCDTVPQMFGIGKKCY